MSVQGHRTFNPTQRVLTGVVLPYLAQKRQDRSRRKQSPRHRSSMSERGSLATAVAINGEENFPAGGIWPLNVTKPKVKRACARVRTGALLRSPDQLLTDPGHLPQRTGSGRVMTDYKLPKNTERHDSMSGDPHRT